MPGNDGLIISESEPTEEVGRLTWLQILADGSRKWYVNTTGSWVLVKAESAPAFAEHTHPNLDTLADIVSLLASGVTGSKTVGGYKFTFNHGVLTDFEQV